VRDEIRERIAGIFGVSQLWMSSTSGIGGLNAESQQLVVMSRVVEGAQRSYHTDVFPKLLEAFGITDWKLMLAVPEEQSELMRLQILQQRLTFAQGMGQLGFGVKWDADAELFTYSGEVKPGEAQGEMGGEGGMEDMFGGGGGGEGGGQPPPEGGQ